MAQPPARRIDAPPRKQPSNARPTVVPEPPGTQGRRYLIGDVAALTGLTPHALRAWERVGLLAPRRSPGGVRQYSEDELARVRLIIRTQRTQRISRRALAELLRSGELRPDPVDYVSGRLRPARMPTSSARSTSSALSSPLSTYDSSDDLAGLLVADEAQRYRRLFDAAARVAAAVVSGAPLGEVLTAICRETCIAFGVADSMLWLLEPASHQIEEARLAATTGAHQLRITAAYGPRAASILRAERRLRIEQGIWLALWHRIRRTQRGIIVQPSHAAAPRRTRRRDGSPPLTAELLVVPLTVPSGETLGALVLREVQGAGRFTEDDTGRAQLFATQAALAIEHARRNNDLDAFLGGFTAGHDLAAEQRHLRREASLVAMQRAAVGTPGKSGFAARAERVLETLVQTAGVPVLTASLHLLASDGQRLVRTGVYGANVASRPTIALDGFDMPGHALLERAYFSDAANESPPWYDAAQRRLWPRTGIHAWAAVPLRATEGAPGVLTLGLGAPLVWTEAERAWISACADTVALALENDRLFAAERQRAEALKAVLDGVDAGITLVDASGRITVRNAAAAALTARPEAEGPAEAERHVLRDADTGAPAALEATPMSRALRGEPVREERLRMRDGQGRDRVMLASSNPVRDPTGAPVGAVTIFQDITEQERRARVYKRLFSQMGASLDPAAEMRVLADVLVEEGGFAATAIYVTAPDGQNLDLIAVRNYPAALMPLAQRMARDAETLSAKALRSGLPQIVARWRDDTAQEGLALAQRMAARMETGGAAALPLLARGVVVGVLLVTVRRPAVLATADVALAQELAGRAALALDNAQLYQQTRATAAQLDAIINAMAEGVWVCDTAGQLTLVNAAAQDLFGLLPGDAPRSLDDFGRDLAPRWPDGRPMAPEDAPLSRGLRGEVSTEFEGILHQAGTERDLTLQLSYAPIRDDAGAITGAVSVGRDITDLRELERSRQDFLAIASHEMKTPLTTLLGFAQVIRRRHAQALRARPTSNEVPGDAASNRAADEAWQRKEGELLGRIEFQAHRLDRLVSDLLDEVRIQQGRLEYHWSEGDVAGAVAEAVDEQRASHPDREIRLRVPEEPLLARLDADRIGQAVTNLLTNALKYSRAEEPVEVMVAAERADQVGQLEAVVRVRDRGPGIPAEHVAHVFERFYRVPGVEVRSGSGIGLGVGLHVAWSIVDRHGGRIWVDEPASPGATFAFTIPLLDPPPVS